jgi:ankyrin repeat protein
MLLMSTVALHATRPGEYYSHWIDEGNIRSVRNLIEEFPSYLNRFNQGYGAPRTTPLEYAIENRQYDIAELLINRGATATEEQRKLVADMTGEIR